MFSEKQNGEPKKSTLQPSERHPIVHNIIKSAERGQGQGHPKKCTAQTRGELKNEPESKSWNDVNSKQVKEEPTDPETNEMCHVTKFGNWEFEDLEAFVKRQSEQSLTGHYEETPQTEAVQSNTSKPPLI